LLRTKNDFPVTQLRAQGGVQRNLSNFFFGNKSGDEKKNNSMQIFDESTDIVIIGGGVSGLTAALTAASEEENLKIVLVEASSNLGGRVQSDYTKDGFILDKGFAVFIDQYPSAAKLLDLSNLQLKPYLPGALIKVSDSPKSDFVRVADPLRQPEEIWNALVVPVGSISDKVKLMPLLWNVRTKSIEELFQEEETSTEYALQKRWGFSKEMITTFFEPFLKGIYLSSLSQQSSLMFSFVMKMFSEGSANLPMNGMGAVTEQLAQKARDQGVDIRTNVPVTLISQEDSSDSGDKKWIINCESTGVKLLAQSVIVATDGQVAQRLLSDVHGFESLQTLPRQPQRSVGCLYYSFQGEPPVTQPILILNGIAKDTSVVEDNKDQLINNLSFPSVVNPGYAPEGYHLCSVTVLQDFMEHYSSQIELDAAVRQQLALWFPEHQQDILQTWELKQVYNVSYYCLSETKLSEQKRAAWYDTNIDPSRVADTKCTTFTVPRTISSQCKLWYIFIMILLRGAEDQLLNITQKSQHSFLLFFPCQDKWRSTLQYLSRQRVAGRNSSLWRSYGNCNIEWGVGIRSECWNGRS
jgi:phytoene dehydrogenase-like protein